MFKDEHIDTPFGNWLVSADTISFNGSIVQRFVIPIHELTRKRRMGNTNLYDWILLATGEEWLTENDLYDLNYAFVFAAAKYGLDFDYDVFDATLAEQFDQFEAEDDEHPAP